VLKNLNFGNVRLFLQKKMTVFAQKFLTENLIFVKNFDVFDQKIKIFDFCETF